MESPKNPIKVAIAGTGSLGTEVMLRMADDLELASCIQHLLAIDPDRVEEKNIALSRLFHAASQHSGEPIHGKFKAGIAADFLNRQGTIHCEARCCEVADISWAELRNFDLLLCCTDNALARVEAVYAARALGIPLLDAGVMGEAADGGRITWYARQRDAACVLCGMSEERRAELLAYASAATLGCSVSEHSAMGADPVVTASIKQTAGEMLEVLRAFVQGSRDGTGAVECVRPECVRPECVRPECAGSWSLRLAGVGGQWHRERIELRRSASCPWHGADCARLVTIDPDRAFCDVLRDDDALRLHDVLRGGDGLQSPDGVQGSAFSSPPAAMRLQLAWPLCTLAICRACGGTEPRPQRVARLRRRGICANCRAAHQLEPLRTLASVGENDEVAKLTPRQLGWTEPQIMQLRPALVPALAAPCRGEVEER